MKYEKWDILQRPHAVEILCELNYGSNKQGDLAGTSVTKINRLNELVAAGLAECSVGPYNSKWYTLTGEGYKLAVMLIDVDERMKE